jgi:CheY-like chemotaxis protein/two-component sensor histidine kinase
MIDRQVGHLARLIDDLLDVSRIVAGKLELRRERIDLAALVRERVDAHRGPIETSGLRLSADLASGPFPVSGDRRRLAQIVDNLLQNARKFTPPGGTVSVKLSSRDGCVLLAVTDTGIGMDAQVLQHAFEAFSQADRSLERAGGGLGLGLALVKGLVDLHGGEVRAASAGPRKGSQLTIELPLDATPAVDGAIDSAVAGRKLRVLVIEDNVDAADSLQTLLKLAGHEVQTALSGPSGLAVAERYRPEVVLCDIGLPGMDGYEVARTLRKAPATAKTHLVALTGYGQDEDRQRGRDAGFDDYLTKPADFGTLQRVMLREPARG